MSDQKLTPRQAEQVWDEVNSRLDRADMHLVGGRLMWLLQTPEDIKVISDAIDWLGITQVMVYESMFGQIIILRSDFVDNVWDAAEKALFDYYVTLSVNRILQEVKE